MVVLCCPSSKKSTIHCSHSSFYPHSNSLMWARLRMRMQPKMPDQPPQISCASPGVLQMCHKVCLHHLVSLESQCEDAHWPSHFRYQSAKNKFMLSQGCWWKGLRRIVGVLNRGVLWEGRLVMKQVLGGDGIDQGNLCHSKIPLLISPALHQSAWRYTSEIIGTDPCRPIEMAAILYGIRALL